MDKLGWHLAWGLCLLRLSLAQIDLNITCRYAGVFHVEKNGRYSISRTEAADLCKAFNSTLPTMAQMERALSVGFETCRYGFIEGHVVIPRIQPNAICAANHTGVYILISNTSQYDTYCFNASAPPEEDCTSVTHLPNAFDGPITITIVNRDGTRYSQKGEYRTNPEDINPSNPTDDDVSSGSSSERSTSAGYNIFHTHLPTAYPTEDQDSSRVSSNSDHTPITSTDSSIISAGWEPTEENEDERDKHPSYSGSGIDDDEDFISSTIPTTPRLFSHPKQNQDWTPWSPGESNPEVLLQTTTRMTDVDRSGTSANGENWTREPHSPLIHHEHHDEEEAQHATSTTEAIPSSTIEETATQKEQWVENGWHGKYPQSPKEDSHSTAGTAATAQDSHPDQKTTTQSQEDSSWTYFFDPISHPMGPGHQTERWMDMDSSHSPTSQPSADPNTHLVEDLDRIGPLSMTTQQSHTQSFSTSPGGLEEDKNHPTASTPTSNRTDGRGGREGGHLPEDSAPSVEASPSHSPATNEYRTLIPVTPAKTGFPGVTEVNIAGDSNSNVIHFLSEDHDSSVHPSERSHTTHGSESAGHSSGSQEGGANTTSGPMRKPQIPEWLIILASLLALALILAVCIAVNSRRRCGQKKKLVINNGNGAVGDRKPSGINGEASKSQEMVHLVNKEPSETPDQYTTADETRNLQNVDMKIGV
ncbi:CD44 antigen isoform X4 [Canis lupus dingo]|uniref:CD44 antigen isoform X4 n=1 Tax=Canis lupus dingo TaxID=286419 RepID=UPI0003AE1788|nr:CD44 antigen isoform X4 [Canis lupus dingo]XP_038279305.1 CD44 antigen isoform X4 [Canis lupus familiaris]|eukprot:XP_005631090.1 CD44 antigen isoform X3 [Canis lupus familiaris]